MKYYYMNVGIYGFESLLTTYSQGSNPPFANTEASAATSGLIFGSIVSARKFGVLSNPVNQSIIIRLS